MKKIMSVLMVGLLQLGGVAWATNEAIFNFDNGLLTIPKVLVAGGYYDVKLQRQADTWNFTLTGAVLSTSSSLDNVATYSPTPSGGSVEIPTVIVGESRFRVWMALQPGDSVVFALSGAELIPPASTSDIETVTWQGREWQQSGSQSEMTWEAAVSYCANLSEGGHDDWSLPSIETLRSLIVCSNGTQVTYGPADLTGKSYCGELTAATYTEPTISTQAPAAFNANSANYWSSTTSADNANGAWAVDFEDGDVDDYGLMSDTYYARCVRSE